MYLKCILAVNQWKVRNPTERQKRITDYVQLNILGAQKGIIKSKVTLIHLRIFNNLKTRT